MSNSPFSKRFGHDLSTEDVRALFVDVEDSKTLKKFCSKQNTLIWGFRGTGKTMLLRYFDMEVQHKEYHNFREYVEQCDFLGFHLNFVSGAFDIPNLDLELDKDHEGADFPVLYTRMAYTISEHLIIAAILEKMMAKFAKCMDDSCQRTTFHNLATDLAEIIKIKLADHLDFPREILEYLANKIKVEKANVAESLAMFSMGYKMAFEPMQRYMTFEFTFKPIVEAIQKQLRIEKPVFLLLDDVNNLHTFQQKQLNSWIGQRVHGLVCFKVASEPLEQRAFGTLSNTGRILQKDHDYNEIYLDFDTEYTELEKRRAIYVDVADRRLKHFFQPEENPGIEELLQESPEQNAALERISEELKKKHADAPREIYREKWVTLHRESKRVYAGMDDLAILSFGNIREFLSICDELYNKAVFKDGRIQPIPPETQHGEILRLSKAFSMRVSSFNSFYEKPQIDDKLNLLIKNLLSLFRYRLYKADLMEKSFDAFAVKNQSSLSDGDKSVLRRGIERQYFRKTYYSMKEGGRQDIFVVNKLLFPEHRLNIRETGGKYEFSDTLFSRALVQEGAFLEAAKASPDPDQLRIEGIIEMIDVTEEVPEYEFGRLY